MVISGEDLGVAIDDTWLFRGLNVVVDTGECLVLAGPNGVGKSTFLRLLHGTQRPAEGSLTVCGGTPDERRAAFLRKVSVLMDDFALFDELSPRQHLDLLLRSHPGASGDPAELLEPAGLQHRADAPAADLSAGQWRRLLIVAAIARPHEVLLLDEPERALDAEGREWLR
ncbi:ABC transporter ATP-binding protein [Amycolatopsis minnesotensis]|uniref:ABC transporter ATP-binding protein n=1 Tax=Amycolatopsis minnesotensis TaxID=337894 RepID=A0ABP5CVF5_9PSEU